AKKHCFILLVLILASCSSHKNHYKIKSPDGKIIVEFLVSQNHKVWYKIERNDAPVLQKSCLGVIRKDGNFAKNLKLKSVSGIKRINKHYSMKIGKKSHRTYNANEQTYHLVNASGKKIDIIFRVS